MSDAAQSPAPSTPEADSLVGETWRCHEADADDLPAPWDRPHEAAGIADWARFRAVVESVTGGVAELTVTLGNGHPRTPETAATLDIAVETLHEDPRWTNLSNDDTN